MEDYENESIGEGHAEPADESFKTHVVNLGHPLFSSTGIIDLINSARNFTNTSEKELSGEVKLKVIVDMMKAARETKVPYELLLFACDWDKDMTSRSDAGDAKGIAQKMLQMIPQLRQSLGRDPLHAEVFAAHALKSAAKVKQIYDKSVNQPDEEAQAPGTDKDNIVQKKLRNAKEVVRTNRELYDYFFRRVVTGKVLFKQMLGKDKYGS